MSRASKLNPVFALLAVATALLLQGCADEPGQVRILFTGETMGELEPCNCASQMAGGLPARAGYIARQTDEFLLVDTGCVSRGAREFERLRGEATLRAMKTMGYDAVNIGEHELWLKPDELAVFNQVGVPFVSANVTVSGQPGLIQPYIKLQRAGRTFTITGVVDDAYTQVEPAYRVDPPSEAIGRLLSGLPEDAGQIIVLADLTEPQVRDLAREYPELDVILFRGRGDSLAPTTVNRTIIASVYGESRYLADIKLTPNPQAGFSAQGEAVLLVNDYAVASNINAVSIDWYKQQINGREFNLSEARPGSALIRPIQAEPGNGYVGSAACAKCHKYAHNKWSSHLHSVAMKSLQESGYDYSPECVVCHVVAYGASDGYVSMQSTPKLGHVGCESCHGPGKLLLDGNCNGIARRGSESDCKQCHYGKHDPGFSFENDWALIDHTEQP